MLPNSGTITAVYRQLNSVNACWTQKHPAIQAGQAKSGRVSQNIQLPPSSNPVWSSEIQNTCSETEARFLEACPILCGLQQELSFIIFWEQIFFKKLKIKNFHLYILYGLQKGGKLMTHAR